MRPSSLVINDKIISYSDILTEKAKGTSYFEQNTFSFIKLWLSNCDFFTLQTSGSTGAPKKISVKRNQILSSIKQTATFLNLKENQTALICLDTSKIAGIMMLARALEIGMKMTIISPASNPLEITNDYFDFCAMVPLQVQNTSNTDLARIQKLIIGGGSIQNKLEERLITASNAIYHTYGMTETLSHVALREITPNPSKYFHFLPGVDYKVNQEQCLQLKSPVTEGKWIHTNDIIELDDDKFLWLGRIDNTINSGGYKFNLDVLTQKIQQLNPSITFVLSSLSDENLGEKLILISLNEEKFDFSSLATYEKPRQYFKVSSFPLLPSGKIDPIKIKNEIHTYEEWLIN